MNLSSLIFIISLASKIQIVLFIIFMFLFCWGGFLFFAWIYDLDIFKKYKINYRFHIILSLIIMVFVGLTNIIIPNKNEITTISIAHYLEQHQIEPTFSNIEEYKNEIESLLEKGDI